jgi:hypothetical protein
MPEWLDKEAWGAFLEMRKSMGKRAPFTLLAEKRTIHELERLESQGHPNGEVLWQSVMMGYRGVFPLKNRQPQQTASFRQQDTEAKRARVAEMTGGLLGTRHIEEVDDGQLKIH